METNPGLLQRLLAVDTLHNEDESVMKEKLQDFIRKYLPAGERIDLLLTGENGDSRLLKYYSTCESVIKDNVPVARFKHMSGEYPTATAMGLWLCCTYSSKPIYPRSYDEICCCHNQV